MTDSISLPSLSSSSLQSMAKWALDHALSNRVKYDVNGVPVGTVQSVTIGLGELATILSAGELANLKLGGASVSFSIERNFDGTVAGYSLGGDFGEVLSGAGEVSFDANFNWTGFGIGAAVGPFNYMQTFVRDPDTHNITLGVGEIETPLAVNEISLPGTVAPPPSILRIGVRVDFIAARG